MVSGGSSSESGGGPASGGESTGGTQGPGSGGANMAGAGTGGAEGESGGAATGGATTGGAATGGATTGGAGNGTGGSGDGDPFPSEVDEQDEAALLDLRQEHSAAALLGEVYVLGGFTPNDTASVQAYNPETENWRDVEDFPALFHHPNVSVVDDLLYVTGFHLGGGALRTGDDRSFVYDPATDQWSPLAPLPEGTGRGASCVAQWGGKIYVFGGSSDPSLSHASAYDIASDEWEVLPDLPEPRDHCFGAGIDGKLYIVAGRNGGIDDLEPESWVYDPQTQQYEEIAPIPTPRGGVAGGVVDGQIYVIGGEGNANDPMGIFGEVEVYDPPSDAWKSLPDMAAPRHGMAGATIDRKIYLAGGAISQGFEPTTINSVLVISVE